MNEIGDIDKWSNSSALTEPLAAAYKITPYLDYYCHLSYHMAVKSAKLLTCQSHTMLQCNCSHSLNVPFNCNTPVPPQQFCFPWQRAEKRLHQRRGPGTSL